MRLKDKRGRVLPRDIVFMMIMFSAVIAFSSILVTQMGTEYGNTDMVSDYDQSSIGSDLLENRSERWRGIGENLQGGLTEMLKGTLQSIGEILQEILLAPVTFANVITSIFDFLIVEEDGTGTTIKAVAQFLIAGILYAVIIFGIIKVFLRGGDV